MFGPTIQDLEGLGRIEFANSSRPRLMTQRFIDLFDEGRREWIRIDDIRRIRCLHKCIEVFLVAETEPLCFPCEAGGNYERLNKAMESQMDVRDL